MKYDSILFDMDGTLWDAVDSYCRVWDVTVADSGLKRVPVSRHELEGLMGLPLTDIYDCIIGAATDRDSFLKLLADNEERLMPQLGGRLYPGVKETIATLAQNHRLFMVSNCMADGLPNFLAFTGLAPYFTDHLSYGQTGCEKDVNIRTLVERYNLRSPLYVGDTAGDCRSAHAAGVPFARASWGFGHDIPDADLVLHDISELPDHS